MQRSSFHLSRWLAMLLTVLGLLGTASAVIIVPNGSLRVSPAQAEVGQVVTAQYSVDERDATAVIVNWGDGTADRQSSIRGVATHRYSAPKTYLVQLFADNLRKNVANQQVIITAPTACELTADPNPAQPGKNVDIVVKFTGPADSKYGIDFGDGSVNNFGAPTNKVASFKHTYQQTGPKVVVVNDLAAQRPLCRLVVNMAAPAATLSLDPNPANVGQTVTATLGNLTAGVSGHSLDWGDGTTVPVNGIGQATLKHAYTSPGVYIVKLNAGGAPP